MCKPNQYINDICHNCHPQSYDMTAAKFTGQENIVEIVGNPDASFGEYLYECCKCGEQSWVDESWVRRNAAENPEEDEEMKIKEVRGLIQQRANDGFFDVAIKFSDLDDLKNIVSELEKGGYLLGLRCDKVDCLYVSWVQRGHFLTRWVDNLDEYMNRQ